MGADIAAREQKCGDCENRECGNECSKWRGHWPRPEIYSLPNIFNPEASCPVGKWGPEIDQGSAYSDPYDYGVTKPTPKPKNPPRRRVSKDPAIHHVTPWDCDKNIGAAYNRSLSSIREGEWVCFLDGDAIHTTNFFGRYIAQAVRANPWADMLTCWTNRVACPWQILPGVDQMSDDVRRHRRIGQAQWDIEGPRCTDVTDNSPLSGVLMVVSRESWLRFGGFLDGMLGVDNEYHQRIRDAGGRVARMDGIYVYHWYRGGCHSDKGHLL